MLRKRSESVLKDQSMASSETAHHNSFESFSSPSPRNMNKSSLFTVAGLFLGQGPKALSDCDSVMSPTSPLDLIKFPISINPFKTRKSWDRGSKVGLSLIDALDDNASQRNNQAMDAKNIVLGPKLRIRTSNLSSQSNAEYPSKSLPSDHLSKSSDTSIFIIADASDVDGVKNIGSLHTSGFSDVSSSLLLLDFLSFCYSCCKDLAGKDIYIYRGEKAFCSSSCRELEMDEDHKGLEEAEDNSPGSAYADPDTQD